MQLSARWKSSATSRESPVSSLSVSSRSLASASRKLPSSINLRACCRSVPGATAPPAACGLASIPAPVAKTLRTACSFKQFVMGCRPTVAPPRTPPRGVIKPIRSNQLPLFYAPAADEVYRNQPTDYLNRQGRQGRQREEENPGTVNQR